VLAPRLLGIVACQVKGCCITIDKWCETLSAEMAKGHCAFSSFEGSYGRHSRFDEIGVFFPNHFKIILVREPHEWLLSAIYHEITRKRIHKDSDGIQLSAILSKKGGYNYTNYQTKWLTGGDSQSHLSKAKNILSTVDFFGITHHYEASMCLMLFKFNKMELFLKHCECDSTTKSMKDSSIFDFQKNTATSKHATSNNLLMGYMETQKLYGMIETDMSMFTFAQELFLAQITYVERVTNRKLLCK